MSDSLLLKQWLSDQLNIVNITEKNVGKNISSLNFDDTVAKADGDINELINLINSLSSNTYLKHSDLWDDINLSVMSSGQMISSTLKDNIELLNDDLSKMCANYSQRTTTTCQHNSANASTFSQNQVKSFTQHSGNSGFTFNSSRSSFSQNTQGSSFSQNSTNANFSPQNKYGGSSSGFSQRSMNATGVLFSQFSSNRSGSTFSFNATNSSGIPSFTENNTNSTTSFTFDSANSRGFSFNSTNSTGSFSFNNSNRSGFSQNSTNSTFTFNSNNQTFAFNSTQASSFSQNSTNFTQYDNYSFIVKSNRSIVTNSLTTPTGG